MKLAIIGFGEAGSAIAQGLRSETALDDLAIACFDVKSFEAETAGEIDARAAQAGVTVCHALDQALSDASLIFSTVTAGSALDVARSVAGIMEDDQDDPPVQPLYFDMNSVAPGTKRQAADWLNRLGVGYVDTAVMAPIHPRLHKTPMLLAGPFAAAALERLVDWGMDLRAVGEETGRASAIKMLRSVVVKGLEALSAEMALAAIRAGVEDEVIASLDASYPGFDWGGRTAYNLERMATHGRRRAEEMEEVVRTLEELGISPDLTTGTVERQRRFGDSDLDLSTTPEDLHERAQATLKALAAQKM